MFRNFLALGFSTGARLIINAGLLIVLARYLGVDNYGIFVTYIAITSIAVVVVDFGFSTYIVKFIAEDKTLVQRRVTCAIALKIYLTIIYLFICNVISIFMIENGNHFTFSIIIFVTLISSFFEFLNISFRSISKFYLEAKINILSSFCHLFIIIPSAYITGDINTVAISYLVVKLITLIMCYKEYYKEFGSIVWPNKKELSYSFVVDEFNNVKYYGFDSAIINIRANVDTVIIKMLLGYESVGIYQAGVNIVKALERVGPILANVFLPKMAKLDEKLFNYFMQLMFFLVTVSILISLIVLNFDFEIILGTDFAIVNELMPYFMIYMVIRYICMGLGVFITVINLQKLRVKIGLFNLFFAILSCYILIPLFELHGAVYSMLSTALMLFICYFIVGIKNIKNIENIRNIIGIK